MRTYRYLPVAVLLVLAIAFTGCGSKKKHSTPGASPATSASPVTAESVLSSASQRWSKTQSAHFVLTIDGKAYLDSAQTLALRDAEGDLARPDSVQARAKIAASLATLDIQLVAIGPDMYITNFISGNWEKAPNDFGYNPAVLFSDTDGIGAVLTQLKTPKLEKDDSVDGTDAHVVSGTVDAATINKMTAGAITADNIAVKIWIAKDTSDILKVVITPPASADNQAGTWTLLVTDHNKPVTIESPLATPTP
jgi:lipoprotein LprG